MIIRGNTVSTTIAPEKIAEKIGRVGTMYVGLYEETGKASHTAEEIYKHAENDGVVLLDMDGVYFPLVYSSLGSAEFNSYVNDQDYVRGARVFRDGSYVTFSTDIVTSVILDERIGDISTALDELHTYAQGLIGGAAE
jgi:hypothetical protein